MSDGIFFNRFIERQGNGRERAWHILGTTFAHTENKSALEAVTEANMDFLIKKFPLSADMSVYAQRDGFQVNQDGTKTLRKKGDLLKHNVFNIPDQFAIVRQPVKEDPNPRFFGQVGDSYTLLQNTEIASLIDRITGYTNKKEGSYAVETVGCLGMGETIFFALSAGRWDIKGDEIEDYLLVTDTRDGKSAMVFMNTPVRVVCQNTLNMALSAKTDRVSLSHSAAIKAETEELLKIFDAMVRNREKQHEALVALSNLKLNEQTAQFMIQAIYPEPEKPAKVRLAEEAKAVTGLDSPELMKGLKTWENQVGNTRVYRAKVSDLYEIFNDQQLQFAGTGYSLYNAVAEFEDHFREGKNPRTSAESAVFGERSRTKIEAFNKLMKLV